MPNTLILFVTAFLGSTSILHAQPKGLDTFIDHRVNEGRFSGVVLIGKLTADAPPQFIKSYGDADRENRIPNGSNTKFITASTAKTFVAVGILQLVESKKLSLDDLVSHYIPNLAWQHITIRHLLTHTAGLGDVITGKAFRSAPQDVHSLSDLVALVRRDSPIDTPGKFHYGTSDYILLGAIIESASGQPFATYMKENVFTPAGMLNSGFDLAERPADLAHGYTFRKIGLDTVAGLHRNDAILPETGVPGAVAYTTAPDLLRFARALTNGRLLKKVTLTEMWKGQVMTGQEGANRQYGYGFFVGQAGKRMLINHGGTGPGIDVCFDLYPSTGDVVIILANLDPPAAQEIREYIRDQTGL